VFCLFVVTLADPPAWAQPNPVHTGSIEIGAFGGAGFGTIAGVTNAQTGLIAGDSGASGGVNFGIAINRRLFFQGEASYQDGGGRKTTHAPLTTIEKSTRAWIYEADLQLRFQPASAPYFVPYIVVGGAFEQIRADSLSLFENPGAPPGQLLSFTQQIRLRQAAFAPAVGAGFRYYITPKFGFRVEVKGYFPTSDVKDPFGRAVGGIFFQFR
jgi:hypothetical protein